MVTLEVAQKALAAAHAQLDGHRPGWLFRVRGFPGVFSDGATWVVDVNERGQDWRVKGKERLIKARWPA